ncbi:MAG: hypothetical protein WKF37_05025 [Bryobacteraceae bacterium]
MNEIAYRALRNGAAWIDLTGRGHIRATGDDRVRLLHAMTPNNVEALLPGTGCYAFFLSAQGRILSDANIFCMPDHLVIDTEPEAKQIVMDHLNKFIIADDVTLEDFTPCMSVIAVEGPAAEEVLTRAGAPVAHSSHSIVEWTHALVARTSYTGEAAYWLFTPTEQKSGLLKLLDLPEADRETANAVRLENGKPLCGVDFTNANIPQETQQMTAVSFTKGCYLGQEIVERVRSRGHVNKLLVGLEIEGQGANAGARILSGGKEVGEVTSCAPGFALAMLRAEAMTAPLTVNGLTAKVRPAKL